MANELHRGKTLRITIHPLHNEDKSMISALLAEFQFLF